MQEANTNLPTHFKNLNTNVVNSLKKGQATKHKNAVEKVQRHKEVSGAGITANEKKVSQKRDIIRSGATYIENNSKLTDKLVKNEKYKKPVPHKYEQLDFFSGQEI